jgi:hypothetical protein
MTWKGHVKNGAIVLDEPVRLPDGITVRIEVDEKKSTTEENALPSLAESLASVIGKAENLPADWSENHDRYLREEHSG